METLGTGVRGGRWQRVEGQEKEIRETVGQGTRCDGARGADTLGNLYNYPQEQRVGETG